MYGLFFPHPLPELHMADVDLTSQPQCVRLKRFTSAYFLPAIFRLGCRDCNRRARVPMLLCPLDFFLSFFFCFTALCVNIFWVSSCVGNPMLLRPQPVAADGKKKKKRAHEGERGGSVVITSWLGGSAKAAYKTSAATGTRGCECRVLGGPRCLRGRVIVLVRVFA